MCVCVCERETSSPKQILVGPHSLWRYSGGSDGKESPAVQVVVAPGP